MDVVIHCASNPRDSAHVDVNGTANLLNAVAHLKQPHIIFISIGGVDKSSYPYYKHKHMVERMIMESKLPYSIIRVTQFHDFILNRIFNQPASMRNSTFVIPKGLAFQSIDVADAAAQIINVVNNEPLNSIIHVGGPEVLSIKELAEIYLTEEGMQNEIKEELIDNDFYAIFKSGINLCPDERIGNIRWSEFIKKQR